MGKVKDDSNFQIYGWMVTQLKLKGNELLIYAIIYSFSQNNDGNGIFNASTAYLCEWTNLSRRSVIDCISSLIHKNLIIKLSDNAHKRKPNFYKINSQILKITSEETSLVSKPLVKKVHKTSEESSLALVKKLHKTSEKTSHNNISTTTTTTTIEKQLDFICKLYTTEITNRLCCSAIETEALKKFIEQYGVDAIKNAIQIAVIRNKRSLGYIEGILKNESRANNGTDTTSTNTEKTAPMVRQGKTIGRGRLFKPRKVETIEQTEAKFANETSDWD